MKLNRTPNPLDRIARNGENENWDIIEGETRKLNDKVDNFIGNLTEDAFNKVIEDIRLNWSHTVSNFSDLPSNPKKGDTVAVENDDMIYRYDGSNWVGIIPFTQFSAIAEIDERLTSQLNKTRNQAQRTLSQDFNLKKIFTFMDDDGHRTAWSVLRQLFDEENIPGSLAINTSVIDTPNGISVEQLKTLKDNGWTILSHAHEHVRLGDLTYDECENQIVTAKNILNDLGFEGDMLCYPYGSKSGYTLELARKHSVLGLGGYFVYNTMPLNTFEINRVGVDDINPSNLQDYRDIVDNAPEDSWTIFYSHVGQGLDTESYRDLIQYVKSKDVEILNVKDAYNKMANVVDVKTGNQYLKIGRNGTLEKNTFYNLNIDSDTPVKKYPLGESYMYFNGGQVAGKGFPGNAGGNLFTFRPYSVHNDFDHGSYQTFNNTNKNEVFKRRWDYSNNRWTEWELVAKDLPYVSSLNAFSSSTPISEFTARDITTFYFDSTNKEGFPVNTGTVLTNSLSGSIWSYQLCLPRTNNEETFRRWWTTNGWSDWERITYRSVKKEKNKYSSDAPITDYPNNEETIFYYDSVGQGDFPVQAGVIKTVRFNDDNWSYQICMSYYNESVYRRRWRNGAWLEWKKIAE